MSNANRRRLSVMAVCLWGVLASDLSADVNPNRSAMADAMVRMMEAMGLFGAGSGAFPAGPQGWSNPMGMSGWPSGFGSWPGGVPGSVPMPFPGGSQMDPMSQMGQMGQAGQMAEMMGRLAPGGPMAGAMPWGAGPLEGIWEGSDDGLLIVQGGRYRIYAPFSGSIDGDIRVTGDRVELTNRRESFAQEFEYALDQGRLVLRDRQGQVYLYRRLMLDGGR
ncbi:MAG: hypothetical protein LJE61_05170 [Thiocapsa sp.]|nr:hypothetical protein [Thiocapsa sp.]MCG6896282.1 hypothetical protein [Thiocapsa sp.]MCG6984585.1 hypothetical protein [Thiocapsa sp.]